MDLVAVTIGGLIIVQAVVLRCAVYSSTRLGEMVFAQLREEFVRQVLTLPLSTVERAGSGDLLTRDDAGCGRDVARRPDGGT